MPPGAVPSAQSSRRNGRCGRTYGGGWVGCLFPGQNQISTSSRTLAPKPIICAVPRLPLVQAIHAMIATIARTTIMPAKRTRFAVMASALDLLGLDFEAVSVLMQIKRHHWRGKRIRLLQINR
jgi:hypothetical protein